MITKFQYKVFFGENIKKEMASIATAALKLVPAVYDGLSHEWDVMKQDRTPRSFKRVGHGFKAFGEGFVSSLLGREPNSGTGTNGRRM